MTTLNKFVNFFRVKLYFNCFVGILRHFVTSKIGLGILREKTRHCFLFSRHLIITSRTSDGNFRLAKVSFENVCPHMEL